MDEITGKRAKSCWARGFLCVLLCCVAFALNGLTVYANSGTSGSHGVSPCGDTSCEICYPGGPGQGGQGQAAGQNGLDDQPGILPGGEDTPQNQDTPDAGLAAGSNAAPPAGLDGLAGAQPANSTPAGTTPPAHQAQPASGAAPQTDAGITGGLLDSAKTFLTQRVMGVTIGAILLAVAVVVGILIVLAVVLRLLRRAFKGK